MKIGVLTYHRIVNTGAVIQAFAVTKILKRIFPGSNIEIIDLNPLTMFYKEWRKTISLRGFKRNSDFIDKKQSCENFIQTNMKISKKRAYYNNGVSATKWIEKLKYDLVIVGSDTVWELRKPGYAPRGLNPFCLPYKTNFKKASISASMDPINDIDKDQIIEFKHRVKWIEKFDFISVRDIATLDFIKSKSDKDLDLKLISDPVIIDGLDSFGDDTGLKEIPKRLFEKKVVGLSLSNTSAPIAYNHLDGKMFSTIDLGGKNKNLADYALSANLSVEQHYSIHSVIELLITDRFHASIFTLLQTESPILFFEDPEKWIGENSKGRHLFNMLGIESMVFRDIDLINNQKWINDKIKFWGHKVSLINKNLNKLKSEGFKTIKKGLLGII
jgi:hypothetical protein